MVLKPTSKDNLPANGRAALDLTIAVGKEVKVAITRTNLVTAALTMAL